MPYLKSSHPATVFIALPACAGVAYLLGTLTPDAGPAPSIGVALIGVIALAAVALLRPADDTPPDRPDPAREDEHRRQAQKMEAVGQLAGGIAHDFNNLLTVINGYAETLADTLPPDDPAAPAAGEILAAGRRAADLTRQLLAYSRKQVLRPRVIALRDLVVNLRKMLARLIGEDIRLVALRDPNPGLVRADPGQIEQVLMNLAINARDAMPRGGTLTIEVRTAARYGGAGREVMVAVSDTGAGISEAVKARLFEPFFTTKGLGKGTGLGLATVHGIVTQSGGRIEVESRLGAGTTFRIYLPAVEGEVPEAGDPGSREKTPRGSETILLVEDDGAVRMLALHALQASGYEVLDAEDGEQALRVVETFGVPIQLLLTDVVMPRIDGRELADRLLASQPGLRVLYTSGYTPDAVTRYGVEPDRIHFLPKPFAAAALVRTVRAVLDAPAADRPSRRGSREMPALAGR